MKEKRFHQRRVCTLGIDCVDHRDHFPALLTNLSLGGAFIETAAELPAGHVMKLTIPFTGHERYLIVKGRVVRVGENGLGIEFLKKIPTVH